MKEVVLSEKKKRLVDSFVLKITELLQTVPETPVVEVSVFVMAVLGLFNTSRQSWSDRSVYLFTLVDDTAG